MDAPPPEREELLRQIGELHEELMGHERLRQETLWVEDALRRRTRVLDERLKELGALQRILRWVRAEGLSPEQRLSKILEELPRALRYPDRAWAAVRFPARSFETPGAQGPCERLSAPLRARGRLIGRLEAGYRLPLPSGSGDPFLPEERELLDAAAECLGLLADRPDTPLDAWTAG